MKYLFLLAWFLVFFQDCKAQTNKKMNLNLQITHTEKSKDSHSRTEIWNLKDAQLNYHQTFTGRLLGKKPDQKKVSLSENQVQEIANLLKNSDLYKNIPSPKYSEFHIPYSAITVHLGTQKSAENFDIQLYGLAKKLPENTDYQHIEELVILLNKYLK